MAKEAYQIQLARTMERQRENPEQQDMHRQFNRAYGDFYQFLEDMGGKRPIARTDIDRLEAEGWSVERLESLSLVSHQHFSEQRSISARTIDSLLEEHGFQPQPGLRDGREQRISFATHHVELAARGLGRRKALDPFASISEPRRRPR